MRCQFCPNPEVAELNGIALCREHLAEALEHSANVPAELLELPRLVIYMAETRCHRPKLEEA